MTATWMRAAADRYARCNRRTLHWLLDRSEGGNGFVDTKVHSITGANYGAADGIRGPDYTYGWIQGRALEALARFADHYARIDPGLAARLTRAAERLYGQLATLQARDGHVYFLYDDKMRPVIPAEGGVAPQAGAQTVYTYADAFAAKGLFAAAPLVDAGAADGHLEYLKAVIAAVEDGRFQMDEARPLSLQAAEAQPDDFGPRMILLAASGLLQRASRAEETAFAERFIDHVLDRHHDPASGLLLTIAGEDICNVGHAIEFCGFAFEHLQDRPDDPRLPQLTAILIRSLEVGLQGPGIALYLSASTGALASPNFPWWPMPEAIRACALGHRLTGDARLLTPWQQADRAFFCNYWREEMGFAYQTRTVDGPVDFVPATPDLDPGYHTGLSLLAAIRSIPA